MRQCMATTVKAVRELSGRPSTDPGSRPATSRRCAALRDASRGARSQAESEEGRLLIKENTLPFGGWPVLSRSEGRGCSAGAPYFCRGWCAHVRLALGTLRSLPPLCATTAAICKQPTLHFPILPSTLLHHKHLCHAGCATSRGFFETWHAARVSLFAMPCLTFLITAHP